MNTVLPEMLQTPKLVLRAPRAADAARIFEAYARDPDVTRYVVWRPHQSIAETEAFISHCMQAWETGTRRPYVLTLSTDQDIPIGMVEARMIPNGVDVGYVMQREHWGAGYMTEAILALGDAALAHPECFRVQATCDTENGASARVLEKAGFVREGRLARHALLPNLGTQPRASFLYARCR